MVTSYLNTQLLAHFHLCIVNISIHPIRYTSLAFIDRYHDCQSMRKLLGRHKVSKPACDFDFPVGLYTHVTPSPTADIEYISHCQGKAC